ncbi:hypothetical protein [Propionivibrio sp.]|uniref:hypothetical protein n=1 Tax=Propionivibrio sp. TaxID=2212460 RepID=UPI00272DF196|nr:hypothetical protein [Propionivibrio sp.]
MVHFRRSIDPSLFKGTMPLPPPQVTLLVPELLWPEPEDRDTLANLSCPALDTLLARGRAHHRPALSHEAMLSALFGHEGNAAYAAFRRLGDAGHEAPPHDGEWLAADPVHLRLDQQLLILADGATLNIAQDDAQALVDGLNRHFADIGEFHCAAPHRWYLRLADNCTLPAFDAPPISAVAGRSIQHLLPDVMQERAVRNLYNEIQTFLHAHPVNQQREAQGTQPLNGLWLWGKGRLPDRIDSDFDGVWANDPLAAGLARAAGVTAHPAPADAEAFLPHLAPGTQHLVVLDDLLGPVQYENGPDYRDALARLETGWFAPLRRALSAGRLKGLRLRATTAYAALNWECRRLDQWRVWQHPQPLADLIGALAKESQ